MVWTARERKVQRRAERQGTGRARRITDEDRAAAAAWVAAHRPPGEGAEVTFAVERRDGRVGYRIGERWYRGHDTDEIAARREDAVLVRRSYGEADGDGLWRNVVLYDLRPASRWRRIDLAWHVHRQGWRRCHGLTQARVSAPELLAWAEERVREWPVTLSERITAAEEVVGRMTQGGEVSAALVRSAALERPPLGAGRGERVRRDRAQED